MASNSKKVAAAMAAVQAYLAEEAQVANLMASPSAGAPETGVSAPTRGLSAWALSARIEHMTGRLASLGSYPRRR